MKNITVSVPEEVYRKARIYAAQSDTSVSRLVSEYLQSIGDRDVALSEAADARERIAARITGFSAAKRLTRDEVHDRGALR